MATDTRLKWLRLLDATGPPIIGLANGRAIHTFVLKLHSRCNLKCTYCYLYEMGDRTFLEQPRVMSPRVIQAAARRIGEYLRLHPQDDIIIVLHGGEPLLAGPEVVTQVCEQVRAAVPPATWVRFVVQTNATELTDQWLQLCLEQKIKVSVSLDGGAEANNQRVFPNGRSSFELVDSALQLLSSRYHGLFSSILAVIDPESDPLRVHEHLMSYRPPIIDYVLPHGNWGQPPRGRLPDAAVTPYADWILRIVDCYEGWINCPVEIVQMVVTKLLTGEAASDLLGHSIGPLVIETNGDIERVDTWRSAYHGASQTRLDIFRHSLETASTDPAILSRALGAQGLSQTCRNCRFQQACGGGHPPHRYHPDGGNHPSVYCPDLTKLFDHGIAHLESLVQSVAHRSAP